MSPRTVFLTSLALALLVTVIFVLRTAGPHSGPIEALQPAPGGPSARVEPPRANRMRPIEREAVAAPTPEETAPPPPPARPLASVRIDVRDGQGNPVPDAEVALSPDAGPHVVGLEVPDPRGEPRRVGSNAEGSALFEHVPAGPYELSARKDSRRARLGIAVTPARTRFELVLSASSAELHVRVVDPDGVPIADASVELFGAFPAAGDEAASGTPEMDAPGRPADSATDERGIARFAGLEFDGGIAVATAKDGRIGQTAIRQDDVERALLTGGIRVVVTPAGDIEGELRGLAPDRMAGARVLAYALDNVNPYQTTHGRGISTQVREGRFHFERIAAGTWTISLDDPRGARLLLPTLQDLGGLPNSADPIEVKVEPGRTVVQNLDVREGGTVEGLVRTSDGAPVSGARVLDTFAPRTSNFPDGFLVRGVNVWRFDARERGRGLHPETHPHARTDEQGRYRLAGLQPGIHRIEVIARGQSYDRVEGLEVADGATVRLEHVLERAGAIQGADPAGRYLGVTRAGEAQPWMIAILPGDGRFTFAGLAPGKYVLAQFHSDASVAPVRLLDAEVEAGRTTWVDLSAAARHVRIGGRVVGAHGPVVGARVSLSGETLVTDAAGRFETHVSFAHTMWVRLRVSADEVETEYQFPRMPAGVVDWDEDVALGRESLLVRALDDGGMAARAKLDLSLTVIAASQSHIQAVRAYALAVDERGEHAIESLPAGTYDVRARFESGAETVGSVLLPASGPLVLRAPATGDLVVVVRLPDGSPATGRAVCARTASEGGDSTRDTLRWAETDAEGRARMRGVRAGEVRVEVVRSQGGWGGFDRVLASETLHLARGEERTVTLAMQDP